MARAIFLAPSPLVGEGWGEGAGRRALDAGKHRVSNVAGGATQPLSPTLSHKGRGSQKDSIANALRLIHGIASRRTLPDSKQHLCQVRVGEEVVGELFEQESMAEGVGVVVSGGDLDPGGFDGSKVR